MSRVKVLPQSDLEEGVRREVGVAARVDKPERFTSGPFGPSVRS